FSRGWRNFIVCSAISRDGAASFRSGLCGCRFSHRKFTSLGLHFNRSATFCAIEDTFGTLASVFYAPSKKSQVFILVRTLLTEGHATVTEPRSVSPRVFRIN